MQRRSSQQVSAFVREWPDQEFIKETLEAFPEKAVANVEEARVSFDRQHRLQERFMDTLS